MGDRPSAPGSQWPSAAGRQRNSEPSAGDALRAPSSASASEAPPPEVGDYDAPLDSRPSVSLGPLGLLGFGPDVVEQDPSVSGPSRPRTLVSLASLVIVIAALKIARPVLVPLTVSVFLATLTAPGVIYLKKKGVSPVIGVPLVVLFTLLVFGAMTTLVGGSINQFIQALPSYQARMSALLISSAGQLESWGFQVTTESLLSLVHPGAALGFLGETLSGLADFLSDTFLVLLLTVFVLFEAMVLPDKIRAALGDPVADLSRGIRVVSRIKAYVVVKTWTSFGTGLLIGVFLHLLGVDFAVLWGLLAFLLNYIPNIGSIIASIPAVLMALLQIGVGGATMTAAIFLSVNMVIGSFLEPKIMGQRMNLSPLVVFVSLVFWGWLWGGMGMLLSVPLTMAIRIMLEGHESTRPFAVLMAGASSTGEIMADSLPPPRPTSSRRPPPVERAGGG